MSEVAPNKISEQVAKPAEKGAVKRGDRQTRFLAQSVILEESGGSGLIRWAILSISLAICAFVAWAAVIPPLLGAFLSRID